jgi:hypothetical protein
MECCPPTGKSRDILSRPWLAFGLFWLPTIAIGVTASSNFSGGWRTVVWTAALSIMGTACLANAARCGRVHCYLTSPFFLLMGLVSLLYGLKLLPLGRSGWNLIGLTILIGAVSLCCLPEMLLGKYRQGRTGDAG